MLYAAARPSEKDLKCGVAFPSALNNSVMHNIATTTTVQEEFISPVCSLIALTKPPDQFI
jgi:hypothetical protein